MVKSMNWPMSLINKMLTTRSLSGCFNSTSFTVGFWFIERRRNWEKIKDTHLFYGQECIWAQHSPDIWDAQKIQWPQYMPRNKKVEGKSVFKFKKYILRIYIKFWDWSVLWISNEIHIRLSSTIKDFFISFAIF